MTLQIYEHDVIIVGAGGAGLSAAISAAEQGADVGVVCKLSLIHISEPTRPLYRS